jgi:hypothetical protein
VPPFRGEQRSDPRRAFLHLKSIDGARAALRKLDGRVGPGGEVLQLTLSRLPVLPPARLWKWAYVGEVDEEDCFEKEWAGLGFGTEQDAPGVGVERGDAQEAPPVGSRGGRRPLKDQAQEEREDAIEDEPWEHEELWGDEEQRNPNNSLPSQQVRTDASHGGRGGVL